MAMTASQRRILTKTENEIRGTDPRLASILGAFSRLNRDEQMPQTEQLSARRRLFLRLLPRKLAAPGEPQAKSPGRYAVALFSLVAIVAVVSMLIMAGRHIHVAPCPSAPMVSGARHGASVSACRLTAELPLGARLRRAQAEPARAAAAAQLRCGNRPGRCPVELARRPPVRAE